jgi:hypothetical protein
MSIPKKIALGCLTWLGLVTFLHLWLNVGVFEPKLSLEEGQKRFRIGFLPVT